jgi:hypothetical protein
MSNAKLFEEEVDFDLELNKDVMDVILDNYKKAYVMKHMYNTPEYNTMLGNAESNINKEFVGLEKITNTLMKKVATQQKIIDADNTIIHTLKGDVNDLEKDAIVAKANSLASKPRYSASSTEYTYDNYYIGIQVVGILIVGFMFYTSYKKYSPKVSTNAKPSSTNTASSNVQNAANIQAANKIKN